jgi:hypothetical protein
LTKNNNNFAAMKRLSRKIFFIFSFLAVFFSFEFYAPSKSIQLNNIEIQSETNNDTDSIISVNDQADEDQIYQSCDSVSAENPFCQILTLQYSSVVFNFSRSVWQPPKIF